MLASVSFRRNSIIALTLVALSAFSACSNDDPAEPDNEPEIASLRLTVGSNSVTISTTQSPTLDVAAGSNSVTAEWLKADGTVESRVTDAEFELRIAQVTGTDLVWTATSARAGTLVVTGLAAGASTAARVSLFHKEEQHDDFGPLSFTVRVP
jgi:hypothetical protein